MDNYIYIEWDDYVAAIKHKGQWYFFHETMGMWFLDYSKYDNSFDPDEYPEWRPNLLVVDIDNADEFIDYLKSLGREISVSDLPRMRRRGYEELGPLDITFIIDFDRKLFVNDLADNVFVHEYIPPGWVGIEERPYRYLPDNISKIWSDD